MDALFTIIRQVHPLVSDALLLKLGQMLHREELTRKSFLLTAGAVSRKMYFVEQGLVRGYYLKDDKDVTTWFMQQHDFVISPLSFYRQRPSFEYLQLLEDSVLYSVSYNQVQELYREFPDYNLVGRVLTEDYYVRSEIRAHYLRMLSAEERHTIFAKNYAPVMNRVAVRHIASFLCLTPETVSRIRAKKL